MSELTKPSVHHVDATANIQEKTEPSNRLEVAQQMSPEELKDMEKRLKCKLDLRLLACVWLIFVLNYLDRVGFCSQARM